MFTKQNKKRITKGSISIEKHGFNELLLSL